MIKLKNIYETLIDEDYPIGFDMDVFKGLTSFNQRIKYCQSRLRRISSGSSRIVYQIDNEKVLKLARNQKGLAQNEVEIEHGRDFYTKDAVAIVFDSDPRNLWLEMELATKLTANNFKRITGFNWNDFVAAIHNYGNRNGGNTYTMDVDKKIVEQMWEDEFVYDIFSYIGNYDLPANDFEKLSSYGVVSRNGDETIVVIDFGFTNEVKKTHYS